VAPTAHAEEHRVALRDENRWTEVHVDAIDGEMRAVALDESGDVVGRATCSVAIPEVRGHASLDVVPAARHHGVGSALLRDMTAWAASHHLRYLVFDTDAAIDARGVARANGLICARRVDGRRAKVALAVPYVGELATDSPHAGAGDVGGEG
jgi:GNAT superfamily N-acetyltransferase